jgi:hypothetical protein
VRYVAAIAQSSLSFNGQEQASNPVVANAAGRFAASGIASSYGGAKSPPAPPRRNVGTTEDSPSPSRASPSGLLGSKVGYNTPCFSSPLV